MVTLAVRWCGGEMEVYMDAGVYISHEGPAGAQGGGGVCRMGPIEGTGDRMRAGRRDGCRELMPGAGRRQSTP